MSPTPTPARLADLLIDLREDLHVEVKNWLDLQNNNRDKAILAKAVMALANHGGGFIVLGFKEVNGRMEEAVNRPATLDPYSQDVVNGIVKRYCDPSFHCSVHMVHNPDGAIFPIVQIPSGHRVPIRARRSGPHGTVFQPNDIYVRMPGPRSETPQSGEDWEDLLSRCQWNRRDELLGNIRDLLTGSVSLDESPRGQDVLDAWMSGCFDRWASLVATFPRDVGPRFPHGFYNYAYEIVGDVRPITLAHLPEIIRSSGVRYTGWPPFWYPTRAEIEPYPIDGVVECWLGGDTQTPAPSRDAAHSDFWRISPDGLAYLLRGYQEDRSDLRRSHLGDVAPGTVLDVTLPVWRVGETLLQAERLASNLCEGPSSIRFSAKYTGLRGRSLVSMSDMRCIPEGSMSRQSETDLEVRVETQAIAPNLPEVVHTLLHPLYALFGFFDLPMELVVTELKRMQDRSS